MDGESQTAERPSGHDCHFSHDIAGRVTAGSGKLDWCGVWERPCFECEAWKERTITNG